LQTLYLVAQRIKITTTSIEDVNNKLVIKYGFINSSPKDLFKVVIIIKASSGQAISISDLSGDIGDNITGGTNKQIIWDYNADGIIMEDNIKVEVLAHLIMPDVSMGKALTLSTIWPGLGLSKINKKPYWIIGVVAYGSLAGSYFMNKKANNSYTAFLENTEDELSDGLLSTSQSQNQLSKTLAYSAIGIWGINLVWTAIKAKKGNQSTIGILNKQKLFFSTSFDPFTKTKGFSLTYRF
jgi:hypothetical protein